MNSGIRTLKPHEFPALLREIDDTPELLYIRGSLPPAHHWKLCIVGSRKSSDYGKRVVDYLVSHLRGLPITIISGLALGIDGIAHRAALDNGLPTVAVVGSGLDQQALYPKSHHGLAQDIVDAGGALISEFAPTFRATRWSFPQRNRIMAGLAHGIIIVEATEQSGTLITARLGLEYGRDVMAVPGSIFSVTSAGPHQLIHDGATPIRSAYDICALLGIDQSAAHTETQAGPQLSNQERIVYDALATPCDRNELIRKCGLSASEANVVITMLEMKGVVKQERGYMWRVV